MNYPPPPPSSSSSATRLRSDLLSKAKGQFTSELKEMLYAHGDPQHSHNKDTLDLLEDMLLEFIYDTCTHANRITQTKSRLKVDDVKQVFRHDARMLGRIEEIVLKEKQMTNARKLADAGTDLSGLATLATATTTTANTVVTNDDHLMMDDDDDNDDADFDRLLASIIGAGGGQQSSVPLQALPVAHTPSSSLSPDEDDDDDDDDELSDDDQQPTDSLNNSAMLVPHALASILGQFQ